VTDLELEVARDTFVRMAADAIERGQRTGDCEPFSRLESLAFDAAGAFVREHKGREDGENPFVTASYAGRTSA
jgi:hypothetical protein